MEGTGNVPRDKKTCAQHETLSGQYGKEHLICVTSLGLSYLSIITCAAIAYFSRYTLHAY